MENMFDKALKVAKSDTVKASGKILLKDIIGILMCDPNAASVSYTHLTLPTNREV